VSDTKQTPPAGGAGGANQKFSFGDEEFLIAETGAKKQATSDKTRLRYLATRLHALGPKPLLHFLDELERGADLRGSLEEYAALPAELVHAYRGHDFVEPFAISGGRP